MANRPPVEFLECNSELKEFTDYQAGKADALQILEQNGQACVVALSVSRWDFWLFRLEEKLLDFI